MVLGAILGSLLSGFLGAIWYAPVVLGNPWMRANFPGKSFRQIKEMGNQATTYGVTMLSCVTLSFLLQFILVNFFKVQTVQEAASVGFGLACLVFLVDITHCAFAQRSFVGFLIDRVYDAAILVLMAVCIVYCNQAKFNIPWFNIASTATGTGKKSGL